MGSFTIANTASLEIGAADSENIIFAPSSNALLKLDHVSLFTGAIGGLNTNDKINLADLPWVQGHMTAVYSGTTAGGTLTISNGTQTDQIKMLGNFLSSSWKLNQDNKSGSTDVVDPLMRSPRGGAEQGIGFSDINFGANSTLAYSADKGSSPFSDDLHTRSLALLSQYAASIFVKAGDGYGGALISDPLPNQQPLLTQPHASQT
jgi:hypothetical protein